jgi:hypothetical protein
MAYGLIRVRELGRSELKATQTHNAREYDELGLKRPDNIDFAKTDANYVRYETGNSIQESIDARIKSAGVKERSNSVVAIEFVVGASKDFYDAYSASGHFSNCEKWLKQKYGAENVVARTDHYDESNPHAHFIVVPIVKKEVKWKNSIGEGVKKQNTLSARDLTGNKQMLKDLQQAYFDFIQPYGKAYGVKFQDRTPAEEQLKVYTKQTIGELGHLRHSIREIRESIDLTVEKLSNGLISAEKATEKLKQLQEEQKKVQEREKQIIIAHQKKEEEINTKAKLQETKNRGDGWKKGQDFNIGF